MQKDKMQTEKSSFESDLPKAPPLPELPSDGPVERHLKFSLSRSAKGLKYSATSDHRVWRVVEDDREQTKYEVCERFYATQRLWDRSLNPGIMELSTRELAKEFKRVCEAEAQKRRGL